MHKIHCQQAISLVMSPTRVRQEGGGANQNKWGQMAVMVAMFKVCKLQMSLSDEQLE